MNRVVTNNELENNILRKLEVILEALKKIENQIELNSTWLSVPELADYLKSSESAIRRLISTSSIPFQRVGAKGKIIFNRKQIDLWLLSGKKHPGKRVRDTFKDLL